VSVLFGKSRIALVPSWVVMALSPRKVSSFLQVGGRVSPALSAARCESRLQVDVFPMIVAKDENFDSTVTMTHGA
jgi:hypothetical protein